MGLISVMSFAVMGITGFGAVWLASGEMHGYHMRQVVMKLASVWERRHVEAAARHRKSKREQAVMVTRDMPTFLDIVMLGISAGLSFDASLDLYCERFDTTFAHMVGDAMLSWRMGIRGRGEAIRQLASSIDSPAMIRFATAVEDALAFGTPLAGTLERQAQLIREEQRASVEAEIERVPVRMLIPLGTLIVPAMLLAILGPLLGPALSMA